MEEYVILIFILIIIAIAYLFNSYFLSEKNYIPLQLEQQQYNTYKDKADLPESLVGTDNINYANFIKECAPGKCVVNTNTGIKRCPEGNDVLVYDFRVEGCTNKDNCEDPLQPYAVMEDGSTTTSKFCGKDIECRCSRNISCPYKDLSYFNLQTDNFTSKNYNFINVIPGVSSLINPGQVSINIGENDSCKLNPAELTQIRNGCDLKNSVGDPINCGLANNNNYGRFSLYDSENQVVIGEFNYNSTKSIYPIINCKDLPITAGGTKVNIILYIKFNNDGVKNVYKDIGNPIIVKANTTDEFYMEVNFGLNNNFGQYIDSDFDLSSDFSVVTRTWDKNGTIISLTNFLNDYTGKKSEKFFEKSIKISGLGDVCSSAEEVNYKNTLMCLQTNNDFCPLGIASYNYDQEVYNSNMGDKEFFSRRFCQQKSLGNNFLDSPSTNTISCALGSGCDGGDLTQNQKSNKYFPDFDMNGLKNIFDFSLSKNNFDKDVTNINNLASYNPLDEYQILKKNLTKGDIWNILMYTNTLTYTGVSNSTGTCFSVSNLGSIVNFPFDSLDPVDYPRGIFGSCIGVSYVINGFDIINNSQNKITNFVTFQDTTGLAPYLGNKKSDTITINIPKNAFSSLSGILRENPSDSNNLQLCEHESGDPINENSSGVSITYNFIKQFGFNGYNYNTTIQGPCTTAPNIRFFRENKYSMVPPYTTSDKTNELIFENKRVRTESIIENAPFNTRFSMYYPVWNPVLERQECVRCKPLFSTYLSFVREDLKDSQYEKISDVTIQYSGRDFLHYEKNLTTKKFCFTTVSKMKIGDLERVNTSKKIYLDKPNPNIKVGDYIIDSNLDLNVNFKLYDNDSNGVSINTSNNITEPGLSMLDLMGDYGINDSIHSPIYYEGTSLIDNNNLRLKYNSSSKSLTRVSTTNPKNYFFGKLYTNKGTSKGVYIEPLIKVQNITGNTITTDTSYSMIINENLEDTYLQFCRLDSTLGVSFFVENTEIKEKEIISIDSISDGRITNLTLETNATLSQPVNFNPEIRVSNYKELE